MDSDERDPSRYFMVFETGDNSTVAEGEAEPDDLFYSRAESFGDDYVVWFETDTGFSIRTRAATRPMTTTTTTPTTRWCRVPASATSSTA